MKTPYPWFGGKGRIAETIWQAFGDCPNYVEPFFGGGAVVLNRPGFDHTRHTETVNDLDCNVANFWRCLQKDPEQLASWADWPVSEVDLHSRHQWLVNRTWGADSEFRGAMMRDPDHCDFKQAGWWVWGICQWIGSGWCNAKQATVLTMDGNNGMGVHRKLPHLGNNGRGVHRQLPHLGDNGRGVHRQLPHLGNNGRGVHRQLPHLGDNGRGGASANLYAYFEALAERTRCLRICCGDFERVLGPTTTERLGITGVLLDPPYDLGKRGEVYACESDAATRGRQWALDNGHNPKLRIILCGYEGEHDMPEGWRVVAWKAAGGFGSQGQGRGRNNASLERLWLSPACLPVEDETPCSLSLDEMAQWRRDRQQQLSLWGDAQ